MPHALIQHDPPLTLTRYLAEVWPVVTSQQAEHGWSRSRLRTLTARGRVTRILPGVYCLAEAAHDPRTRASAAIAWDPLCVVTGQAALHLYRPPLPAPEAIDVAAPRGHHPHPPPWLRCHQVGTPLSTGAPQGVRCTTPERALIDAWRYAAARDREELVWEALWARACSWRQLAHEADRAARVPDRHKLTRMLKWFEAGTTSPLEVRARFETFADARFREFEWQAPLAVPGRRPVADMLHRRARLVIELDGAKYHQAQADRERDIDLAAAGFLTMRLTWRDLSQRPAWCRERVLAVVASRMHEFGAPPQ